MAHAQKPDFVFRRNGTSPFKSAGVRQFSRLLDSRGVRISGSNAGYTTFRGSVKSNGYPLHSPVSPSLPLPCVTVCHHISTELHNAKSAVPSGKKGAWVNLVTVICIPSLNYLELIHVIKGTAVTQWLRCCTTNRKVAGSIPDGVI